jgi:hypothetical protein
MTLSYLPLALHKGQLLNKLYPEILAHLEANPGDDSRAAQELYNRIGEEQCHHKRAALRGAFEVAARRALRGDPGMDLLARFDKILKMDLHDLITPNNNPTNATSVESASIPRWQGLNEVPTSDQSLVA